ncbi:ArsR/SmtB family transcription factor [Methanoregula sp.]|uniref:ArsR/SmtB family transcription factor n=1 Tax=Methanoregula sp. TaxID=2052170 RepID=UPI003568BED0
MADDIVLLEPGDQRAQKIAKAMSSQTGGDILHLLGEGPKSLTDIADHLKLPMNTAKYHLENLLDAGLIAVAETKYSVKGREVKIYTLTNQLLIVAPRHSNVRSLLLKYATLFGIVAVCSMLMAALSPLFSPALLKGGSQAGGTGPQLAAVYDGGMETHTAKAISEAVAPNVSSGTGLLRDSSNALNETFGTYTTAEPSGVVYQAVARASPPPDISGYAATTGSDFALAFFLGGVLVIFVLLCYEAYLWKKK